MFARPPFPKSHSSEADVKTLVHNSPEDTFDAGESTVYDNAAPMMGSRLGKAPAHAHIPSVDSATMRLRRIATLAYNHANEVKEQTRQTILSARWLVLVTPPPLLLEHSPLGSLGALGPAGRELSGILMPLCNTLFLQLSAIAREFNFPSTTGICCYMNFSDNGSVFAPRITDDAWIILWRRYLLPDDIIAPATSSGLPIAGRLEFDIDLQKARWYDGWVRSGHSTSLYHPSTTEHSQHEHWEEPTHAAPDHQSGASASHAVNDAVPRRLSLLDKRGVSSLSIRPVTRRTSNDGSSRTVAPVELEKGQEHIQPDDSRHEPLPAPQAEATLPHEVKDRIQKWRDESAPTTPVVFERRGIQPYMESETMETHESPKIHIPYLEDDVLEHTGIFEQELDLDDFTWSISSAGPPVDFEPLPSIDTPMPSVHILNRMEGSVMLTASIATSWGPASEWPETPASESVVPTPDLGNRMVDNAQLTPSTATSWGPPRSYPASPIPVEHIQTPDLAGRMAEDIPRTPSINTAGADHHPDSPSTSQFASTLATAAILAVSLAAVPERTRHQASPSRAQIDLTHGASTSFGWPYVPTRRQESLTASSRYGVFNLYPPVYPHFDIYPAIANPEPAGRSIPAFGWPYLSDHSSQLSHSSSSKHSDRLKLGWPYMSTTRVLLPLPPSPTSHHYAAHHHGTHHHGHHGAHHASGSLNSSKTLRHLKAHVQIGKPVIDAFAQGWPYTQTRKAIAASPTSYGRFTLYPSSYPHFEIYPALACGDVIVPPSATSIAPVVSHHGTVAAGVTPSVARPHAVDAFAQFTQTVATSATTAPILDTRYPVLIVYAPVYPHLVVYPEWSRSSDINHRSVRFSVKREGYPHFDIYPVVSHKASVGSGRSVRLFVKREGYPHFDVYPAVSRKTSVGSGHSVRSSVKREGYPHFDIYPVVSHKASEMGSEITKLAATSSLNVWDVGYPTMSIYPAVYPHFDIYPPVSVKREMTRAVSDHKPHSNAASYPVFNIYPAIYPFFEIYPRIVVPTKLQVSTPASIPGKRISIRVKSYPVVEPYPPVYPHLQVYPVVQRAPKTVKKTRASPGQYPNLVIYPAVHANRERSRTVMPSNNRYPTFVMYPPVYPHFDIYPEISRSPVLHNSGIHGYPYLVVYPHVYPYLQVYAPLGPVLLQDETHARVGRSKQPATHHYRHASPHRHIHRQVHGEDEIPPVPPIPVNLLAERARTLSNGSEGDKDIFEKAERKSVLSNGQDRSVVHHQTKQKHTHAELHASVFPSDTTQPATMVHRSKKARRTHAELFAAVFGSLPQTSDVNNEAPAPVGAHHPIAQRPVSMTKAVQRPRSGSIWTPGAIPQQTPAPLSEQPQKARRPTSLSLRQDIIVLPSSGTTVSVLSNFGAQGINPTGDAETRARPQKLDRSKYPFF